MAKKGKGTDMSAEGASSGKKNDTSRFRRKAKSWADMNEKERIAKVVARAASLAKLHDNAGAKSAKALSSNLNSIVKPGGKIEHASAEETSKLYSMAKKALGEMKNNEYGSGVKELLRYCLVEMKSHGGGGNKGFSAAGVQDWEL